MPLNRSLKQRLWITLLVASCLYWSAIAALTFHDNQDEVHELYDIHLAHTALALLRQTDPGTDHSDVVAGAAAAAVIEQMFKQWPDLPERQSHPGATASSPISPAHITSARTDNAVVLRNVQYGRTLRYQVWRSDGQLVFQSSNAPNTPITQQLGFSESQDPQGTWWRHYSIWNRNHEVRAVVSEVHNLRTQLVRGVAISSIDPIILGMPFFVLLLWLSVKRGLVPLTDLGRQIALRQASSLELLDESKLPRELRPIVLALNDLLRRIDHEMEKQRSFNANAAHELNTPLAAIQAHLYVARNAESDAERQHAMDQAQLGVERGIRLVSQMLTLARLDPQQARPDMQTVELRDIAQNVCAELFPIAMRRQQTLELVATADSTRVMGNADLLHRLMSNLVDNAIRYSPPEGDITLEIKSGPKGLRLTVCDSGPGIPEHQRDKVFNRFCRLSDESIQGNGLGLSICVCIADLHQAHISLDQGPNGQGLAVHVEFIAID